MCGTAHSIWVLVFYRVLQGLGGGALQPTAQAIMFETYPPEKRGAAMAIFGMGAMVGPAIGPTLGGWIVDNATWPLIFYINIPIGIVAFFMTLAFIPDPKYIDKPKGGIDWIGSACSRPASRRCSTCSSRANATIGSPRETIVILHGRLGRRAVRRSSSSRCATSIRSSI